MNRKQNDLPKDKGLHVIKDLVQLIYANVHANDIANNLGMLIDNTYRFAPVRKKKYCLKRNKRHHLTQVIKNTEKQWQEKHWEEAIFRKWEKDGDGLDELVPFKKILSYQVMLRNTNKDHGWGELDLLGVAKDNSPVAIELKVVPGEDLLRAIVEVLANGIAIHKAWNDSSYLLSSQWSETVGKVEKLCDLPLVVMGPASYWESVLSNSFKKKPFQTPSDARQSIKNLLEKMSFFHYPLTFIEVNTIAETNENGLPDINAKDITWQI